jgi:hypothetical protein
MQTCPSVQMQRYIHVQLHTAAHTIVLTLSRGLTTSVTHKARACREWDSQAGGVKLGGSPVNAIGEPPLPAREATYASSADLWRPFCSASRGHRVPDHPRDWIALQGIQDPCPMERAGRSATQ